MAFNQWASADLVKKVKKNIIGEKIGGVEREVNLENSNDC